jgi:hypothetical protein
MVFQKRVPADVLGSSTMRFDADIRDRLRRRLLRRGEVVATLLAEVLAGKDKMPAMAALGVLRPGIRPEEALRNALNQIESRRRLLIADDDRYGRCDICGIDLGVVALDEMAWADRCAAHAAS